MKYISALCLTSYLISNSATAAVSCTETILSVVNHSNGNVYFSTDVTCGAGWCQLAGSAEFVQKGYAMLMAAQIAGKKVAFEWPGLSTCTQNALYSSPAYMLMYNQ